MTREQLLVPAGIALVALVALTARPLAAATLKLVVAPGTHGLSDQ